MPSNDISFNFQEGHIWPVVGKMTTFDHWPRPFGWGAWGAGTNMWHPETPASYESLPAPLAADSHTLDTYICGERARGAALILDRCRAYDLFASVDAHLCIWPWGEGGGGWHRHGGKVTLPWWKLIQMSFNKIADRHTGLTVFINFT